MKATLLVGAVSVASIAILGPFWSEMVGEEETPVARTSASQRSAEVVARQPAPKPVNRQREQAGLNETTLRAALSQRQLELEKGLYELREELHQALAKLERAAPRSPVENAAVTLLELDEAEVPEAALGERLAQMDSALQAQTPDLSWSAEAEDTLLDSLGEFLVERGGELVDVECRQSMCRVESFHDNEQSREVFIEEGFVNVRWDHEAVTEVEQHADGSSSVIRMISREGHRLPSLENG